MEKVPTTPNLASRVPEIVSALKQEFHVCNEKELKLTKHPDCSHLREKFEKTHCLFLQSYSFLF